jgi:hypothetical protein
MPRGGDVLALAEEHLGERYLFGVLVPKGNPSWAGPWDCAELATWLVYTVSGLLYGVADPDGPIETADAWTGYWLRDANERGTRVSVAEAAACPGAFVLRHSGSAGHIAVSDGHGGTVEARSSRTGVVRASLANRRWDTGVLIPWLDYDQVEAVEVREPRVVIYRLTEPAMADATVGKIQEALAAAGFDPGPVTGGYGELTAAAVRAYQATRGLVVDGEVGPQTARSLAIRLPRA